MAMISIVIPVFNQLHYTRSCLESLSRTVPRDVRIVVVNNGSSDGSAEFLASVQGIQVVDNPENRGCAAAWNQGVKTCAADWTVILNNDVLLAPGWLDSLIKAAGQNDFDIVSPAIREGEMNYDLEAYAGDFVLQMHDVKRCGSANGICFMVRRAVFESIGFFDENFKIGQFEDTDFFLRAQRAGFKLGTTGASFIHHFGSVTQDAIRKTKTVRPYEAENRAYFRQKWKLQGVSRLIFRLRNKARLNFFRLRERLQYGHSLNEKWINGQLRYY